MCEEWQIWLDTLHERHVTFFFDFDLFRAFFVRNTKADTYDYGNIAFGKGKIAKFLRVSFEFSDSTLNRLIESIGYMKIQDGESVTSLEHIEKPDERREGWTEIVIGPAQIGATCSLKTMIQLIEVADKRVDLDVNYIDWAGLIDLHIRVREQKRQNPWTFGVGTEERCLLYHAIKFQQYFLVRALLEAGANPNGAVLFNFGSVSLPLNIHPQTTFRIFSGGVTEIFNFSN